MSTTIQRFGPQTPISVGDFINPKKKKKNWTLKSWHSMTLNHYRTELKKKINVKPDRKSVKKEGRQIVRDLYDILGIPNEWLWKVISQLRCVCSTGERSTNLHPGPDVVRLVRCLPVLRPFADPSTRRRLSRPGLWLFLCLSLTNSLNGFQCVEDSPSRPKFGCEKLVTIMVW